MNDASMCVITSMNFLSCYEVRSVGLVMAWMLEIHFILRNFHEQIKFLQIFPSAIPFLQLAGCWMQKCALQKSGLHIFPSAIPFSQLVG